MGIHSGDLFVSARSIRTLCTTVTMTRVFASLHSFVRWRTEQGYRTSLISGMRCTLTPASSAATCLMRYENQKLEGLTFDLDDDEIIGCHLVDCRILLGGKRLPIFSDNHSQGCDFEFSKSALVTIQMLRHMLKIPLLQDLVLMELGLLPRQMQTLH
jgi:hypothetical protein